MWMQALSALTAPEGTAAGGAGGNTAIDQLVLRTIPEGSFHTKKGTTPATGDLDGNAWAVSGFGTFGLPSISVVLAESTT